MTIKKFIKYLSSQNLLAQDLSQFTIDWVDNVISEYHTMVEHYETTSPKSYFSSVSYDIENIIKIMDKDLPDYLWFKLTLEYLERR